MGLYDTIYFLQISKLTEVDIIVCVSFIGEETPSKFPLETSVKEWLPLKYEPVVEIQPFIVDDDILWHKTFGGIIKLCFCFGEFVYQLVWWKRSKVIKANYSEPVLGVLSGMRHYFSSLQRWYAGKGSRRIIAF